MNRLIRHHDHLILIIYYLIMIHSQFQQNGNVDGNNNNNKQQPQQQMKYIPSPNNHPNINNHNDSGMPVLDTLNASVASNRPTIIFNDILQKHLIYLEHVFTKLVIPN